MTQKYARPNHECSAAHWQRVMRAQSPQGENEFEVLRRECEAERIGTPAYRAVIFRHAKRHALPWIIIGLPLAWAMISMVLAQ